MADEDDLERLRRAGASALTHLGNGVPAKLDRHKNPIWAGLCSDGLSATMITDGHHIPPCLIKTFIRTKGIEHFIVISDGSALTAMPPGRYHSLGSDVILEESGRIYNTVARCLGGSSATMLQCMNYLASLRLLTPEQLMTVGFRNPLRLLGIEPDCIRMAIKVFFDPGRGEFCIFE
jgi:N-acetylglucosamine-6-phosphate deacetylase